MRGGTGSLNFAGDKQFHRPCAEKAAVDLTLIRRQGHELST